MAVASGDDHGLYLNGSIDEVVANNIIANNSAYGIQVSGTANGNIATVVNLSIYNNTIVGNGLSGIVLWADMNGIDIANNILDHNGTTTDPNNPTAFGIHTCAATGSGVKIRNNLFYANKDGDSSIVPGPGKCADSSVIYDDTCGNILNSAQNSDPKFVNAAAGDWHILSDSGAILNGANLYSTSPTAPGFATDQDYDGNPRPSDTTHDYDIGAYVYGGQFPLNPPALNTDWNATSAVEQLKANSLSACPAPATVLHTRYKRHTDLCWIPGGECACGSTVVLAASLTDGNQYDVQVAWGSGVALLSHWSVTQTVTIGP